MAQRSRSFKLTKRSMRRGRKTTRKKHLNMRSSYLNSAIVILSVLCLAFLFSILHRHWRDGVQISLDSRDNYSPRLILTSYEESPLSTIEVEILNGCGVLGIAHRFTDFLRSYHFDVVKTDNADRFDYTTTHIIQRSEQVESSYRLAEILGISKSDTTRILIEPDLSLATDVTLIIGKDYNTIKPFQDFLRTQP